MKRPYSSPKLTKYNSASELPDHIRKAIASVDKKIYIMPNGGLHGLQCATCLRVFYANTPAAVNEMFDRHVCDASQSHDEAEKPKE